MQLNLNFVLEYSEKTGLDCKYKRLGCAVQKFKNSKFDCLILGNPIISDELNNKKVFEYICNGGNPALINSQFLIILHNKNSKSLHIYNDRFTSIPLYYAVCNGRFFASLLYGDLIDLLKQHSQISFSSTRIYEYIRLQRIVGDKTLDEHSKFLLPARHLVFENQNVNQYQYWKPSFKKTNINEKKAGEKLAYLFRQSIKRLSTDNKRMGLFLSGGHDSRTIAMASNKQLNCYTVSFSNNYEVKIAKKIAASLGFKFNYIELSKNHYNEIADESSKICSGMYSIDNALFLKVNHDFKNEIDIILHGHGIDYLFQGMYLPSSTLKIFGRPTFIKKLKPVPENVADFFVNNIPYRLKYINHKDFIKKDFQEKLESDLIKSVDASLSDLADPELSSEDKWELLTLNGLSRHYSWPNIASKMTLAHVRTPVFDNDIYDFYLSLPSKLRVTGGALRSAQKILNNETAAIPTANFGLPCAESPLRKTVRLIIRKILRDISKLKKFSAPMLSDRTWPDRDIYLNKNTSFQALVNEAINSSMLAQTLPELEWSKIRLESKNWIKNPSGGAGFLISLTSVYLFLKRFK